MGVYEVVMVVVVFATLITLVDQVRRLIGHAILNRTIRIALEKDSASAALLIAKLEDRNPMPVALPGWVILALGLICGIAAAISRETDYEVWLLTGALIVLGGSILGWDLWNRMQSAKVHPAAELPPPASPHQGSGR